MLEQSILESAGYRSSWPASAEEALEQAPRPAVRAVPGRRRDAGHGRLHLHRAHPRRRRACATSRRSWSPRARRPRTGSAASEVGAARLHRQERVRPGRHCSQRIRTPGGMTMAKIRVLVVEDSATVRGPAVRGPGRRSGARGRRRGGRRRERDRAVPAAAARRRHDGHDAAGDERARRHRVHHGALPDADPGRLVGRPTAASCSRPTTRSRPARSTCSRSRAATSRRAAGSGACCPPSSWSRGSG